MAVIVLGTLPALTGFAIARLRGRTWASALVLGATLLAIAVAIVVIKAAAGHWGMHVDQPRIRPPSLRELREGSPQDALDLAGTDGLRAVAPDWIVPR